jgi:hypothetical protein
LMSSRTCSALFHSFRAWLVLSLDDIVQEDRFCSK